LCSQELANGHHSTEAQANIHGCFRRGGSCMQDTKYENNIPEVANENYQSEKKCKHPVHDNNTEKLNRKRAITQ
jgi:hypothetical protein